MDIALIIFPGTNREQDMLKAIESFSDFRVRTIWHKTTHIEKPDLIILPGGFSHGDYLRCGAMAAHSSVMREVIDRAKSGTPVLGICNGFQILLETGLLPGALLKNKSLKFTCKNTWLKASTSSNIFTAGFTKGDVIQVPLAHGEGNYFAAPETLNALQDNDQIAFQYCGKDGEVSIKANPNGSVMNIAGIINQERNILGMMPHPENAVLEHQGLKDGQTFFKNILNAL